MNHSAATCLRSGLPFLEQRDEYPCHRLSSIPKPPRLIDNSIMLISRSDPFFLLLYPVYLLDGAPGGEHGALVVWLLAPLDP